MGDVAWFSFRFNWEKNARLPALVVGVCKECYCPRLLIDSIYPNVTRPKVEAIDFLHYCFP